MQFNHESVPGMLPVFHAGGPFNMVAQTQEISKAPTSPSPLSLTLSNHWNFDLATWRELEHRAGSHSLACGARWTECWLESYGDLVPSQILTATAGGRVRGLCLLTNGTGQKEGPFRIRTRHVGTAGEPQPGSVCVEYNRLLVEDLYRDDFIAGIVTFLKQDRSWEQLRLDGFSAKELQPWLAHFPKAEIRHRDSKYYDFESTRNSGGDILDSLGRSTRSNIRRRLRQYGELTCDWAQNIDQAAEIFEELVQLHQARWQATGEAGAFSSERFFRFQTEASLRLFLEQKAVLFRVRHQSETVGCLFLLVDDNRLLDYLSGFAAFDAKPSPGLITHYLCMSEAIHRGYAAYDFLVGDKRHKENLSNAVNQLCWLKWTRPSLKFFGLAALRTLKHQLSRRSPRTSSVNKAADEES